MSNNLKSFAAFLFILLFVYAAASKLLTFSDYRQQLYNQDFPHWMAGILLYTLPPAELLIAGLLCFSRTQRLGLQSALVLMLAFTGYIALVLLHFWDRIPCSCGGILNRMGWGPHIVFNICFVLLALAALSVRGKSTELT